MSTPGIGYPPAAAPQIFPMKKLPNGLRVFENGRIQAAVDNAIASLEPGESWAIVGHHVYRDDGTVIENVSKVSVVVRLGDHFSVAAGAFQDWTKHDRGVEGKVILKG
jgi:hypothetical protein